MSNTTQQITQTQLDDMARYMVDDLREALHGALAPCDPNDFWRAYVTVVGPDRAKEVALLAGVDAPTAFKPVIMGFANVVSSNDRQSEWSECVPDWVASIGEVSLGSPQKNQNRITSFKVRPHDRAFDVVVRRELADLA